MDDANITAELRAIERALEQWSTPTIVGGQVASLIRATAPELDVRALVGIPKGPGAVAEFTSRYLSNVLERIGKQGADVLYRIAGRAISDAQPTASPQIWRTFVSPKSPLHLVLSRSAQSLIVRDTPALPPEESEVAKATLEEHDKIRAGFVASMSAPSADILAENLPPDADFAAWMVVLKERLPDEARRWGHYRRQQLSQLLAGRITVLGLDGSLERTVLEQVGAAERAAYEKPPTARTPTAQPKERHPTTDDEGARGVGRARQLAHSAIDALSYDELRALRLPLGAMLDAIGISA